MAQSGWYDIPAFTGTSRIRLQKIVQRKPFLMADVQSIAEPVEEDTEIHAYRAVALELLEKMAQESNMLNLEMING